MGERSGLGSVVSSNGKDIGLFRLCLPSHVIFCQVEGHWHNPTIVTPLVLLDFHLLPLSAPERASAASEL